MFVCAKLRETKEVNMYVELQDFELNRRPNLDGLARSTGFPPFEELSAQTDISGA